MTGELSRVAGAVLEWAFARHFDVTAYGQKADTIIRIAAAKAEQPLAEAKAEDLDPDATPLGHHVVAEFMDEDKYA